MSTPLQPRKPLLASLMSLVLPGFGQLYNGQVNKAIWLYLGYCALAVLGTMGAALYFPSSLMMAALATTLCLVLALWLYGLIDAWRTARKQKDYVPRVWQTGGLYLLVFAVCMFIAQPLFTSYVRQYQVESFHDPSSSMEPTLMHGDFLFADKRYNCPNCKQAVRRGDVAIITYPNNRNVYYVKRIVGLPGERVQVSHRTVSINGRSLQLNETQTPGGRRVTETDGARRWEVVWTGRSPEQPDVNLTVPAGQVFVLGDNRDLSEDSRTFGTVPLQDVLGKVRQVWFSHAEGGTRWERMGAVIE